MHLSSPPPSRPPSLTPSPHGLLPPLPTFRSPAPRSLSHVARAVAEYPSPELTAFCKENFPENGVADVEEARALVSDLNYTFLDVRSNVAVDEGKLLPKYVKVKHVPMVLCKRGFEDGVRTYEYKNCEQQDWMDAVKKAFPDTDQAIVVICADGRKNTIPALVTLEEMGYTNIVGLKGGYRRWSNVFDNKLGRRVFGEYKENYMHGADTCGIHASGAGFAKMDPRETGFDIIY